MKLAAFYETGTIYVKILRVRFGQNNPLMCCIWVLTPPKANLGKNGGGLTQPLVHIRWNSIHKADGKSKTHWDEL